ncbi:hypothetical protein Tco_1093318 [Tanacetum coccineum]|uniref:Uncharacterized protein n=1 Tax=Tanacetum coccineum TaxID=301880 RepID=A0ABQ5IDM8_9ASTR
MAQIAGSIGAKGLSSRLVSIFFRKIGCPPTMMVVLSLSMAKLCVFPDLPLSMDSAECAHKPEDPELRLGPPETPLERGKASLPSLNELPPILYEQQIQIPGRNLINVKPEKNKMASIINQLPKNELQGRKKQIEQRPPLSVRSSRSSSPTKPTTPCSSLSALAGESLRMNVGLDRGIKTSSTGRERIGESVTEMKAGVGQTVHVAKVKPIVRVRVLVQDRTVWDLLLRALEASNQPGRSRSEVYYLTKGRVSGIRGFAIPVSLRRCSRPKSHVMLSETPRTTRIEDAPLVRKHNGLACGANGDLRLQEGKRQPPSSKDFFEGGALLYSFARETST